MLTPGSDIELKDKREYEKVESVFCWVDGFLDGRQCNKLNKSIYKDKRIANPF